MVIDRHNQPQVVLSIIHTVLCSTKTFFKQTLQSRERERETDGGRGGGKGKK